MTRLVRDWTEERVDTTPVAPHRYTWDREQPYPPSAGAPWKEVAAWKDALPYQAGDVVYVARGGQAVLARVLAVYSEFNHWGERSAKYRVQLATKAGLWSRSWVYMWPGFIQRGYALAGLAPDVPTGAWR